MTIYCSKADVVRVAPEMSTLSDDDFTFWGTEMSYLLNATTLGDRKKLANAYLIAHAIALTGAYKSPRSTPAIQSQSLGGGSVSFAAPSSSTASDFGDWCRQTSYGRSYWSLIKLSSFRTIV